MISPKDIPEFLQALKDSPLEGRPKDKTPLLFILCIILSIIPVTLIVIVFLLFVLSPVLVGKHFIYLLKRGSKWHR